MSTNVNPVTRGVSQSRITSYADVSGDHNPIHVDDAFARDTQFGGTVAHGMLVLALIGEMMHVAFGEAWLRSGKLKVRFKAPTMAGETMTASATSAKTADGVAEYVVQVATSAGEVVIEGRASVSVAP